MHKSQCKLAWGLDGSLTALRLTSVAVCGWSELCRVGTSRTNHKRGKTSTGKKIQGAPKGQMEQV